MNTNAFPKATRTSLITGCLLTASALMAQTDTSFHAGTITAAEIAAKEEAAHKNDAPDGMMSLGPHLSGPMDDFRAVWDRHFVGFGGQLAFPVNPSPFYIGGSYQWDPLGRRSFKVPVNNRSVADTVGTLRFRSSMHTIMLLVRLAPLHGRVVPYVDAMGGAWLMFTSSNIEVETTSRKLERSTHQFDAGSAWGWAAGFMVRPGKQAYIDLRFERTEGGYVTYVNPASIQLDAAGRPSFERSTTPTTMYRWQITLALFL